MGVKISKDISSQSTQQIHSKIHVFILWYSTLRSRQISLREPHTPIGDAFDSLPVCSGTTISSYDGTKMLCFTGERVGVESRDQTRCILSRRSRLVVDPGGRAFSGGVANVEELQGV